MLKKYMCMVLVKLLFMILMFLLNWFVMWFRGVVLKKDMGVCRILVMVFWSMILLVVVLKMDRDIMKVNMSRVWMVFRLV